jgi:hypothetical protein
VSALDKVLMRLNNVRPEGEGYKASCPVPTHGQGRGDRNPSLSVRVGDDGRVLLNCFADCEREAIVEELGLTMADLFERRNGHRGGGSYPSRNRETVKPQGCTLAAYSKDKQLSVGFLETLGISEIPNYNGHPAVRFPYLDVSRDEACVRFRISLDGDPKIKTRRGDKLTLYGLWKLEEARERGYVVAVEGESDTQTLWCHDFPAIGMPGSSSWRSEWSEYLDGIGKIYVPIEPDQGGEQLWERMTASPIRERLYRVTLGDFKDVSELYLDDPVHFSARLAEALGRAVSFMDIAESEAQEQAREAWAKCEDLANEEHILDRFAEDLKRCGVAGKPRAGKLIYLALNSHHLDAKQLVNVVIKGPSSAGKTYTVEKTLEFYPENAYHFLTAMSERALAYSEESLSHRFLILAEAAGMSGEFATYLIRSLLSEGRLRYETVEKTSEGIKPKIIEREGPTGLIVTTTRTKLHNENETRMLTVVVDDTADHTSEILAALADEDHEALDMEEWQALQVWLETGERRVTIPYSKRLARMIPPVAVRLRRDFGAILNLIRSHALLHRARRDRDGRGRIVATIEDYAVVRELVADLISEGVGATVPPIVRQTVETARKLLDDSNGEPIAIKAIGDELGLDRNPAYRRVQMALDDGYLKNLEDRKGRPARLVLGDTLPDDRSILPEPRELEETGFTVSQVYGGIEASPPPDDDPGVNI